MIVDRTYHGTIIQLEPGEAMQLRAILRDNKYDTEVVQSDRMKEFRKTLLEKMEDNAYLHEERMEPMVKFIRRRLDDIADDQVNALFSRLRTEMRNRGLRWERRRLAGET